MKHLSYNSDMEQYVTESAARILHESTIKTDDEFKEGRLGLERWIRDTLRADGGKEVEKMLKNVLETIVDTRTINNIITKSHVKNTLRLVKNTIKGTNDVMQSPTEDDLTDDNYFNTAAGKRVLERMLENSYNNTCMRYHDLEVYGIDKLNNDLRKIPGYEKALISVSLLDNLEDSIEKRYWCGKNSWVFIPMLPIALVEMEK